VPVAVRIAECGDGLSSDVRVDAHWFAGLVVNEVYLRQAHEHGLAIAHLNHRLGWNQHFADGVDTLGDGFYRKFSECVGYFH
jgi:hypothetical protein